MGWFQRIERGLENENPYLLKAAVIVSSKNALEKDSVPLCETRHTGSNVNNLAGCIRPKDGWVVSLVFAEKNPLVPDLPVNLKKVSISRRRRGRIRYESQSAYGIDGRRCYVNRDLVRAYRSQGAVVDDMPTQRRRHDSRLEG